jgi:uncharacterized protein (DUF1499 family)
MKIFDKIKLPPSQDAQMSYLEQVGDCLTTPGRRLFGDELTLAKNADGKEILKKEETFLSAQRLLENALITVLLPLSAFSTVVGLGAKLLAHTIDPSLEEKYHLDTFINARTEENFAGRLPKSPLTPNCVNSQKKSIWGKLYDVEPIQVPRGLKDPLAVLEKAIALRYKPDHYALVEKTDKYAHYTFTVVIPSGALKGTYIDDLDAYYDEKQSVIEIRSASRKGIRDAVHLDFKQPGANKKRVEAIRAAFNELVSNS